MSESLQTPESPVESTKDSKESSKKKKRYGQIVVEGPSKGERSTGSSEAAKEKPRGLFQQIETASKPPELAILSGAGQEKESHKKRLDPEVVAEKVAAETDAASSEDAPDEDFSPEEEQTIDRTVSEAYVAQAQAERPEVGEEAEPETVLTESMLDDYYENLAELGPDAAYEQAAARAAATAEELARAEAATDTPHEADTEELGEAPEETAVDGSAEASTTEDLEDTVVIDHEPVAAEAGASPEVPSTETEPIEPVAGNGSNGGQPPNRGSATGSGVGGRRIPPNGGDGAGFGGWAMPNPNVLAGHNTVPPLAATPDVQPRNRGYESIYDDGNPAIAALIGGIAGYLIGRRRGRKKAAREFKPVRQKLEKRVVDLEWNIRDKESKLRNLAAERVKTDGFEAVSKFNRAFGERPIGHKAYAEKLTPPTAEKPNPVAAEKGEQQQLKQAEQQSQVRAVERTLNANKLHAVPRASERIGQVLVAAGGAAEITNIHRNIPEAPMRKTAEKKAELEQAIAHAEKVKQVIPEKHVETLNRAELMRLSEMVVVEGSTLRQIYETHLISEKGLRRLVAEHLRGGDLKQALRREIVEREIDFERDPAMRDVSPQTGGPTGGGKAVSTVTGKATLDQMLEKAATSFGGQSETLSYDQLKAAREADAADQADIHHRILDISLGGIIVALITAVLYLYVTRG